MGRGIGRFDGGATAEVMQHDLRNQLGLGRRWCGALCCAGVLLVGVAEVVRAEAVSFRNDVMPVLSKAGCNAGVCHGNLNGKGGFKLSLRGQFAQRDFATLRGAWFGRRTNVLDPDRSLVLLKPTMQVAHEGGQRFAVDSQEYAVVREWIAAGMPPDPPDARRLERLEVTPREKVLVAPDDRVQLSAVAYFSDGSTRDVTRMTVYETSNQRVSVDHDGLARRVSFGDTTILARYLNQQVPVRLSFVPARPAFVWSDPPETNAVDRHVFAQLETLRINPSAVCSDGVFVRRVSLDLLGILPTAEEARAFVADETPDRRARLVDRLLERPAFADFWALKWADVLRIEEKTLDRKGVQAFHGWIRRGIAEGKPLDAFARELIAARGSTYAVPPANYYRAIREPLDRAETTAQVFLGVRLLCAKCHNHPFERWTQDDYYGWAALFARVRYKVLENRRRDRNDSHEFDGEQIVWMARTGELEDPRTGRPARPQFLGADSPPLAGDADRLAKLAAWVAGPGNAFFARAQVNRIWYHLLGRGIVDPVDDFRATNPPVNRALLDALTKEFVAHLFDLRHLIRVITNSRTYQLSARPNETNRDDATHFSRAIVRRMSAEQLLDALAQVAAVPPRFNGYPTGMRATQLPGVQAVRLRDERPDGGDAFLTQFGKPPRLIACECERTDDTTMSQAFGLISGPMIHSLLTHDDNRLTRLLAADTSNAQIIDELFWSALARPPSDEERAGIATHLDRATSRRAGLEDVLWGLLNAKEFLFRQ